MKKLYIFLLILISINVLSAKKLESYDVIYKGKVIAKSFYADKKTVLNDILLFSPTFMIDHKIKDKVEPKEKPLEMFEPFGDKKYLGLAAIGMYAFSFTDVDKKFIKFSEDFFYSFLYTGGFVAASKLIINRTNPNGIKGTDFKGRVESSFISGHSALSFSAATAISLNTENRYIKYLSYSIASLVCLQRVQSNSHFVSDVVYGAYFGYKITQYVCNKEDYGILYISKVDDSMLLTKRVRF